MTRRSRHRCPAAGWHRRDSVIPEGRYGKSDHPHAGWHAARGRHRFDFATLAALVAAEDFRAAELTKKDRKRLQDMVTATRADRDVMAGLDDAAESLNRLERAARIKTP
jgi:hypothetical protein